VIYSKQYQRLATTSQFADDALHEAPALREVSIAEPEQMKTGHHDTSTGPPFQNMQQIVAEAGSCSSASVQLSVNGKSHLGRIDIQWQHELGVSGVIVASAAL
jgi:hypothetical protein